MRSWRRPCGTPAASCGKPICAPPSGEGRNLPVFISTTGCSGMAKGDSGDVFAGLLAGWRTNKWHNIRSACEIHGLAGVLAEEKYASASMTARDIVEMLPEAFRRLQNRRDAQP